MEAFFTADWHLDHNNILIYQNRPFEDVKEMAEVFFRNTSQCMKKGDTLWILGDFCWHASRVGHFMGRLPRGVQRRFVCGNHDAKSARMYVSSFSDLAYAKIDGERVHMSHYPLLSWRGREFGSYHFYGHSHGASEDLLNELYPQRKAIDVGIDHIYQLLGEWRPVAFAEIRELISQRQGA